MKKILLILGALLVAAIILIFSFYHVIFIEQTNIMENRFFQEWQQYFNEHKDLKYIALDGLSPNASGGCIRDNKELVGLIGTVKGYDKLSLIQEISKTNGKSKMTNQFGNPVWISDSMIISLAENGPTDFTLQIKELHCDYERSVVYHENFLQDWLIPYDNVLYELRPFIAILVIPRFSWGSH